MDVSGWIGLITAATTILGAVGLGLKLLFNQFNGIIDELRKQLAVTLLQIQSKQDAIDELRAMNADCEADSAQCYAWMVSAHAFMCRHKHDDEDVPPLPPRRPRMAERADYIQRRAEQNTQNSAAAITTLLTKSSSSSGIQAPKK